MSVSDYLYEKHITCPVCDNEFTNIAVKKSAYKIDHKDTDLCVYYKEVNPVLYDVWICPYCGYAALKSVFEKITPKRSKMIKDTVSRKWVSKGYSNELTNKEAITRYKLALISAQASAAKMSEIATLCLRAAWIYRFEGDKKHEDQFLSFALEKFEDAYNKERFPWASMDEATAIYIIAELNRRLGDIDMASQYFSQIVSKRMGTAVLLNMARDQWQLIKDEIKKQKEE